MNQINNNSGDVLSALKNSSKGQLIYDRHWKEERRTQEIMTDVKLKTSSLTVSPKSLQTPPEVVNKSKSYAKYKVIESSTKDFKHSMNGSLREDTHKSDKSLRNHPLSQMNTSNDSTNDFNLILYEKQRQESVVEVLNQKRQSLESVFKKYDEEFDEELKLIRQKYALEAIKRVNGFADDYKQLKDSIVSKPFSFEDNSMTANFKLKEIESKHQLLVEEQHKKQIEIRRKHLLVVRNEIDSVIKSCGQLSSCLESDPKNVHYFQTLKQDLNSMIGFLQNIDFLSNKPDLSDSDLTCAQNIKSEVIRLKDKMVSAIKQLKQNIQNTNTSEVSAVDTRTETTVTPVSDSVSKFVDSNAFKDYLKLQKFSNDFENSFENFVNELSNKQKKNSLQLFVKTTVNTISSESVEHIRDKLNRFTQLFAEKNVEYGGKQIKCNSKDGSLNFCMSLTAKMFISVSTKQKDIALTMAPIIVVLWSRFPTFGQIFLAQMQEKCPYLVPYYPERDPNESEDNYLIACGYTVAKDGTQESEDAFLNRMRAMVRLFAAVIQCNLETAHPHPLKYGWIWLTRLLNLEPRPAITAAILEAFLSIIGHKLYRFYDKQFVKIIAFIQNDYIKRIESVTQKTTKRQSLVKLQMFVDDIITKIKRRVNYTELMPEGVIPDYFFSTAYSHSRGFTFNS